MKPTLGRIVHYRAANGTVRPAIIVQVWNDTCVDLQVFTDGQRDDGWLDPDECTGRDGGKATRSIVFRTSVTETASDGVYSGWYWPPRE